MRAATKKLAGLLAAVFLLTGVPVPAYAAKQAATVVNAAGTAYTTTGTNVRVRSGPGTGYAILVTVAKKGTSVSVTGTSNKEWYQVTYTDPQGKKYSGYMASQYLKKTGTGKDAEEPQKKAATGAYSAILEVNLREKASAQSKALTAVPKGNLVNVTDTSNADWFKVTFINSKGKKYTGCISSKYLKKAAEPYTTKAKVTLRAKASNSSKALVSIPKGDAVSVTAVYTKTWYKVTYTDAKGKGYTGYLPKKKLNKAEITNKVVKKKQEDPDRESKAVKYTVTAKVKLRKKAKNSGKAVTTVPRNAVVGVLSTSNKKWYKVEYKNAKGKKYTGYLPKKNLKKYVEKNAGPYVTTVSTVLRSTASQTGKVVADLKKNVRVEVTDTSEKTWYKATYTDAKGKKRTGYVFSEYLKKYVDKNAGDYVTIVTTMMRATASQTGKVVAQLPKQVTIKVTDTYDKEWYKATYTNAKGKKLTGYVFSEHLKKPGEADPDDTKQDADQSDAKPDADQSDTRQEDGKSDTKSEEGGQNSQNTETKSEQTNGEKLETQSEDAAPADAEAKAKPEEHQSVDNQVETDQAEEEGSDTESEAEEKA